MTAYDMRLTNRARIWGLLCARSRAGRPAPERRLLARDESDGRRLLARLRLAGLAEPAGGDAPVWRLTEAGLRAAERTMMAGLTPRCVMDDPSDWYQRAWTAMRIHRRFTSADIAASADAPSDAAVRRYLRRLADGGVLARDARRDAAGRAVYVVVRDAGPEAPHTRPRVVRRRLDWRGTVWLAARALGWGGAGFTADEVARASAASAPSVRALLGRLVAAGALVAERVHGHGAHQQTAERYALADVAEAAAVLDSAPMPPEEAALARARAVASAGARGLTAAELRDVTGAGRDVVRRWVAAALEAGELAASNPDPARRASGAGGPHPRVYTRRVAAQPAEAPRAHA